MSAQLLSCVLLFCDLMDCSLSGSFVHGIFQEHWSRFLLPAPGYLPNPEIKPTALVAPALAGGSAMCKIYLFMKLMYLFLKRSNHLSIINVVTFVSKLKYFCIVSVVFFC